MGSALPKDMKKGSGVLGSKVPRFRVQRSGVQGFRFRVPGVGYAAQS